METQIVRSEPSLPWRSRAVAFAKVAAPLLAWFRDVNGVEMTRVQVSVILQFDALAVLCSFGHAARLPEDLSLPGETLTAVRRYMVELPGFDPNTPSRLYSPPRIMHFHALSALRHCLG